MVGALIDALCTSLRKKHEWCCIYLISAALVCIKLWTETFEKQVNFVFELGYSGSVIRGNKNQRIMTY